MGDRSRAGKSGFCVRSITSNLNSRAARLRPALRETEGWYLHGTKPETVLAILSGGLNERLCTGLFGRGVYLAEDPEKADQYVAPDPKYKANGLDDLHQILYRRGSATVHPNTDV